MSDLNARLNEIREQAGYEPLPDPGKIQGFGEGAPPPPPFTVREPVDLSQVPEPDYDDEEDVYEPVPPSPLIPQGAQFAPAPPSLSKPDFAVVGNDSSTYIADYLGRQVELTEQERAKVKRVVLGAIVRVARMQMAEVEALLPKRTRRRRKKVEEGAGSPPQSADAGSAPASPPAPKRKRRERLDGSIR